MVLYTGLSCICAILGSGLKVILLEHGNIQKSLPISITVISRTFTLETRGIPFFLDSPQRDGILFALRTSPGVLHLHCWAASCQVHVHREHFSSEDLIHLRLKPICKLRRRYQMSCKTCFLPLGHLSSWLDKWWVAPGNSFTSESD